MFLIQIQFQISVCSCGLPERCDVSVCACPAGIPHGRLPGIADSETVLNELPDGTAFQVRWQSWVDKRGSGRAAVLGSYWQIQWGEEEEHEQIVHADRSPALNETLCLMTDMQYICTACIHCCVSLQSEPTSRTRRCKVVWIACI